MKQGPFRAGKIDRNFGPHMQFDTILGGHHDRLSGLCARVDLDRIGADAKAHGTIGKQRNRERLPCHLRYTPCTPCVQQMRRRSPVAFCHRDLGGGSDLIRLGLALDIPHAQGRAQISRSCKIVSAFAEIAQLSGLTMSWARPRRSCDKKRAFAGKGQIAFQSRLD